jgi:hypothetical protein
MSNVAPKLGAERSPKCSKSFTSQGVQCTGTPPPRTASHSRPAGGPEWRPTPTTPRSPKPLLPIGLPLPITLIPIAIFLPLLREHGSEVLQLQIRCRQTALLALEKSRAGGGGGVGKTHHTRDVDKSLAAEWHEDNPSPSQMAMGNNDKHKWRCSDAECGHVREAVPGSRSSGDDCPQCSRKGEEKVQHDVRAEDLPDLEDFERWRKERIARQEAEVWVEREWNGEDYVPWWTCKLCGLTWQATSTSRLKLGCLYCEGLC